MEIRQTTIDKTLASLKDLRKLSLQGPITGREIAEIAKKNKSNTGIFYSAFKVGYFTRTGRGVYKCNVPAFEPIHARRVIENFSQYLENSRKAKPEEKSPAQKPKQPAIKAPVKEKREISFLFGLFKIKF